VAFDPRFDDEYLALDMEPRALLKDNCMREGIELQPRPLINIQNLDLKGSQRSSDLKSLRSKRLGNSGRRGTTFLANR